MHVLQHLYIIYFFYTLQCCWKFQLVHYAIDSLEVLIFMRCTDLQIYHLSYGKS